ncbi:MFS transporter [Draconibacterium orientale]|uniref:MFS transporter n=1 Tax=Draconibacterium orientale TaxID=1168034 RepID=UPI002A0A6463|nr:MFS transporter [Draconibacterium orientale]
MENTKNTKLLELTLLLASMLTILANAIIAPLAGRLLDKTGRIKVLYISLLIYLLAGTSGFWLGNLFSILLGRTIFGLGVAGIMTVSTTLIGDYFTGAKREHFMGLQGAFVALGGLVFITAAGVLTNINWRLAFLIYGFSAIVMVLVPFALHEPEITHHETKAQTQNRIAIPPVVWLVFISAFITTVSFYTIPVQLPFFLQKLEGINGNKMGLALGSMPFSQAIASYFYKQVKRRLDFVSIYSLGFIPMAMGFLVIGFSQTYWQAVAGVLLIGLGVGTLIPNGNLWMINLVPVQVRGKYVGFLTTATFFGMFISPIIIQSIQNLVGINSSFIVLGVALAVLSVLYLFIRERVATSN